MASFRNFANLKQHAAKKMGFDSTFCQEKPLNAAGNVEKIF